MSEFFANTCHERLLQNVKPALAFDPSADYAAWKAKVQEKFLELLVDMPEKVDLNIRVEFEKEEAEFIERRIIIDVEKDCSMPCHLLIPKGGKAPYPTVICLQGHSTGMHISLGRSIYPKDDYYLRGVDNEYGLQALREGYAVLIMEQRGFGERKSDPTKVKGDTTCDHDAKVAILLGRTLIGERVWDVARAIDMLETMPEVDKEKIGIMGLSGGGTATFYAAAFDERLKVAMPAGSVCSFDKSIGIMGHCGCNYIPGMIKEFDMGEIACLIAPRKLVVVTGDKDPIFLLDGVKKVYGVIEQIYEKENAKDNCSLIVGDGQHRFFADPGWKIFREKFLG